MDVNLLVILFQAGDYESSELLYKSTVFLDESRRYFEALITHLPHAELLFIHPFREGNGRTARLFVDLIATKSGIERFNFEKINEKRMPEYIAAVQAAADKNYELMTRLFRSLKK